VVKNAPKSDMRTLLMRVFGFRRFSRAHIANVFRLVNLILVAWISVSLMELNKKTDFNVIGLLAFLYAILGILVFSRQGIFKVVNRHTGWRDVFLRGLSEIFFCGCFIAVFYIARIQLSPEKYLVLLTILIFVAICLSRIAGEVLLNSKEVELACPRTTRVLIYGAGSAGQQIADSMARTTKHDVVGFLDDDQSLHGHIVNDFTVFNPREISKLIRELSIEEVLIALPSAPSEARARILENLSRQSVRIRGLPDLSTLTSDRVGLDDLREVDIDELLSRDPVAPDMTLLLRNIYGKVVMVTGAGGSIGSELCRQIVRLGPMKIILVESSEYALYRIDSELRRMVNDGSILVPLLASTQDESEMTRIISLWRPNTIYHAAAYKHVPLVEFNVGQGILNNVFGTVGIARAACCAGVEQFVLVSSDKAVRPTNVMGASKRVAELAIQALAESQGIGFRRVHSEDSGFTKLSVVRFGNVLGSSGSVVPLFKKQIRGGGPVTITHPEMTRYFMTIPEAAQLVIQAGALSKGGEIFLLDMGDPVKITDLATRMIALSGLSIRSNDNPEGSIEILYTGLRPGEKLFEELLISGDAESSSHPKIFKAREKFLSLGDFDRLLDALREAVDSNDIYRLDNLLRTVVEGYSPSSISSDLRFRESNTKV